MADNDLLTILRNKEVTTPTPGTSGVDTLSLQPRVSPPAIDTDDDPLLSIVRKKQEPTLTQPASVSSAGMVPIPEVKPLTTETDMAADSVGLNLFNAASGNPQEAADRRRIAKILDVDPSVLPETAKMEAFLQENDPQRLVRDHPGLAKFLSSANNAAIAGTDVPALREMNQTLRRITVDPLIALAKGGVEIPKTALGLSEITNAIVMPWVNLIFPAEQRAAVQESIGQQLPEWAADALFKQNPGRGLKAAQDELSNLYSPAQKEAMKEVQAAKGFSDTFMAALNRPSAIGQMVGESLPAMFMGTGVAQQLIRQTAGRLAVAKAAAVGEGTVIAGGVASKISEDQKWKPLSTEQAALAIGAGTAGGAIGYVGSRILQRLGVEDIDVALARGTLQNTAEASGMPTGLVSKIVLSGVGEGLLQEMPQSAVEQIAENVATGKAWDEGVPEGMALGLLTGTAMGAGGTAVQGTMEKLAPQKPIESLNKPMEDALTNALADTVKAARAEEHREVLEAFGKQAAADPVRARSKETFREFVKTMTDEEPDLLKEVFVDATVLEDALAQSGIGRKELERDMPEVANELRIAKDTGSEVRIATEDFATHIAGTSAEQIILDNLRASPDGMTYLEAQTYHQEQTKILTEQAKSILAENTTVLSRQDFEAEQPGAVYEDYLRNHENKIEAFAQDANTVHEKILDGLNSAGRFNRSTNAVYAVPFREFFTVNAARMGVLPSELYDRYPLNFTRMNTGALLSQPTVTAPATSEDFTPGNLGGILGKSDWVIFTSDNPNNTPVSTEENEQARQELKKDLNDRGLKYDEVMGRYENDPGEVISFLVYGVDRDTALEFARKYQQESVLTPEGFVYQDGSVVAATGIKRFENVEEGFANGGYTRMPGTNALFQVEFDWKGRSYHVTHFAHQPLPTLSGFFAGRGLPGEDNERLRNALDPRIRRYVDFYTDVGKGIIPESGLGGVRHDTVVRNIYNADTNSEKFGGTKNEFESQVLNAGYSGYYNTRGDGVGRVRVLGDAAKSIDVEEIDGRTIGREARILSRQAREDILSREADGSLRGLPRKVGGFEASHWPQAEEVTRKYMADAGLPYERPNVYVKVDKKRAERIAKAFTFMRHAPNNPEVKTAYEALVAETAAQYKAVMDSGLVVEFITGEDPYAGNPRAMTEDVRNNNHMWVFSTRDGFGTDVAFDPADNPLLGETEFEISGQKALVNDLFRVVHDYFGHVKEGVGFRADGEENAWRSHMAMFSPLAGRALTTETRGQNSWVNFGPFGEQNRTASGADTHYADQKIGLLPEWISVEGVSDEIPAGFKPPEFLFQFAGPNALTADSRSLTSARLRIENGENAELVRQETGWFKGQDGKWRFEISDFDATLIDPPLNTTWELFSRDRLANFLEQLTGSRRVSVAQLNSRQFRQYEKFRAELSNEFDNRNRRSRKLGELLNHPRLFEAYPQLTRYEVLVLPDMGRNASFSAEERTIRIGLPVNDEVFKSTLLHEIQHGIQHVEGFAEGGNVAFIEQNLLNFIPESRLEAMESTEAFRSLTTDSQRRDFIDAFARRELGDAYSVYRRLAGEVEARNVQTRANLTDIERRLIPPTMTADIAPEDILVTFNGVIAENAPLPANVISAQNTLSQSAFFSALERNIGGLVKIANKQGMAKVEQVKAWVDARQKEGKFKKEEVEAVGLMEWLDLHEGVVNVADVENFVRENGVKVVDVMHVQRSQAAIDADIEDRIATFYEFDDETGQYAVFSPLIGDTELYDTEEQAASRVDELRPTTAGATNFEQYTLPGGENYKELALVLPGEPMFTVPDVHSFSSEADTNRIAHIRFNERVGENGERVLFIEEIQSDWAQEGRKKGFLKEGEKEVKPTQEDIDSMRENVHARYDRGEISLERRVVELAALRDLRYGKVTKGPFVSDTKSWVGLTIKRMLRYAAENGFDRVAWTTGEQQIDRYGLRRKVETVKAVKDGSDWRVDTTALVDGRNRTRQQFIDDDALDAMLGKDIGDKIRSNNGGTFEGLNLQIGGDGMLHFYDDMVPQVANDVLKRLKGGRVSTISIPETGGQPSFAITPELREKVLEGLPLFQEQRASFNPATFTVSLLNSSDLSSTVHEGAHFYLEALADMAAQPNAPAQIVDDFRKTLEWFGVKPQEVVAEAAKTLRTTAYPRAAGEPVSTFTKVEDMKTHKDYAAAKAGDDQAAFNLVNDLITPENLEEAKQKWAGAIFVPVQLQDKDGANRIPTGMAYHYANAVGGSVSDQIFEARKAFHTGMNAMERLISRAEFVGEIIPGQKYVLVDDVTTIGSTLADLASYITANGGEVVGSTLLTNATRKGTMFAPDKTLKRLEAQYGNEIRELFGIEPAALTGEEAQYLLGFRTADELRNAAAKAESSRKQRILSRQVPTGKGGLTPGDIWRGMTLDQKRPFHEQWAQSFERYALEGVAPTIAMQPVFARFRAWMLGVYKSVKEFLKQNPLAGKLNDDIRGVFDRLIAAEDVIKESEKLREYMPLFGSPEEAGITLAEYEEYVKQDEDATQAAITEMSSRSLRDMRWLSGAKDRTIKALQKEADNKRDIIRAEATTEVMAEPVNRARTFFKTGEFTNDLGEVQKAQEAAKLDVDAVKSIVPEPDMKAFHRMTSKDGMHPDLAAKLFGYRSGEELVNAMARDELPETKIKALTDQRMLERHGDLIDDSAIQRAADEAVHNDARARFMATGLKILQKSPISARKIAKAAKQAADSAIAAKKVRELQPGVYTRAESKANKEAVRLAPAQPAGAIQEQRKALLNNRLAKSAQEALRDVEATLKYFSKFQNDSTRKALGVEYMEQIDDLLRGFSFGRLSLRQIDKNKSLNDWVQEQIANGFEPAIDAARMDELKLKNYKDMTVEELRGLRDTVKQVERLGRLKKKLLTSRDKREFLARIEEAEISIEENANRTVKERATATSTLGRVGEFFRWMAAIHRKFSSVIREMDGGKDGGVMWELLSRPMNEAGNREADMNQQAAAEIGRLFKSLPKEGTVVGNLYTKRKLIPGTGISMSQEERVMFALNWGNEGNKQRLLDGGIAGRKGLTLSEAESVLDTLTKAEWDFVQNVWDFIGSYKEEIAALEARLTGVQPEWVEPTPVVTKFGTYRGGYFPAKYDTKLSTRSESFEVAADLRMGMKGAFNAAATRSSHVQARAAEVHNRPLLLSYNVISSHVSEVVHRLAWQPWVLDANRVLRHLDGVVREHYGPEILRELRDTVNDIALGDITARGPIEAAANHLRVGATITGMGWKFSTAVLQPTGLAQSWSRVGGMWVAKGIAQYAASPSGSVKMVEDKSLFMKNRAVTMQREINEVLNTIRSGEGISNLTASYFTMMAKFQRIADLPTWIGAYEKALANSNYVSAVDEAQRKELEDRAVSLADQAVLDSQSGGQLKDLAKVQRGSPVHKLFTNFYSYFSATYNLNVEAVRRTNFKSPTEVGLLAVDLILLNVVPVLFSVAFKQLIKGGCDADDLECLAGTLAKEQANFMFGQMIMLREASAGITAAFDDKGFGYQGPAGLRFFSDLYKAGQQVGQGEVDWPAVKTAITATGGLLHFPAGQINATIEGIMAVENGDVEGIQILPALMFGPPKD